MTVEQQSQPALPAQSPGATKEPGPRSRSSLAAMDYQQGAAYVSPVGGGLGSGGVIGNLPISLEQIQAAKAKAAPPKEAPLACVAQPLAESGPTSAASPAPGPAASATPAPAGTAAATAVPSAQPTSGSDMPSDAETGWGAVVGDVHGVQVRRNWVTDLEKLRKNVPGVDTGNKPYLTTKRTTYGYSYQCVELVNRYFAQALGHQNMIGTGHAKSYLGDGDRGLETHRAGGPTKPQPGDLMVDVTGGGGYGHVGIAKTVSGNTLEVAQQNTPQPYVTTTMTNTGNGWTYGVWDGLRRKAGAAPDTAATQAEGGQSPVELLASLVLGKDTVGDIKAGIDQLKQPIVRGDKGPRVDAVQRALVAAGFMTEAVRLTGPGIFGPQTQSSVKAFQQAVALPATGEVAAATLLALTTYRTPEQRAMDGVASDKSKSAQRDKVLRDLGTVEGLGEGLYRKAGSIIDAVVPSAGDETSLELACNGPIPGAPAVRFGLRFEGEAEREGASAVRLRVQLGVALSAEADLRLVEAFAQAEAYGWLEASGDDGYEAMRLLSFAIEDRVRSYSDWAADAVWGEGWAPDVRSKMDDDDYAASGLGGSFEAGIGQKGKKKGGKEAKAGITGDWGTRLTKDGKESVSDTRVELEVAAGKWSGKGVFEASDEGGQRERKLSLQPQRDVDIKDFANEMSDPTRCAETLRGWLFEVLGTAHAVITGRSGMTGTNAQQVGAVLDTVRNASLVGNFIADQAMLGLSHKIKAVDAMKMGQRLDIGLTWTERASGWDINLEIDLDQVRSIQLGEDERSAIYAKLEDISNLLHAGPIRLRAAKAG